MEFIVKVLIKCHEFHVMFVRQNPKWESNFGVLYKVVQDYQREVAKM